MAGCISCGIYSGSTLDACQYTSNHSRAEVVVVGSENALKKFISLAAFLPFLRAIIYWGKCDFLDGGGAKSRNEICVIPIYSFAEFLTLGHEINISLFERRKATIRPENCACIIYTAGTTGYPKAVMLSHDNICWNTYRMQGEFSTTRSDRLVSYLPLSHAAAMMVDIYATMYAGCMVFFARPDALKGSLLDTMRKVKPTIFFAVPRVWEKMQEKVSKGIASQPFPLRQTMRWAMRVCGRVRLSQQRGFRATRTTLSYSTSKFILSMIRSAIGLSAARLTFTGAAPIHQQTLEFFACLDMPLLEVYGLSECSGPHCGGRQNDWVIGSCGRPVDVEQKIDPSTGELCIKGRHVFMGYLRMPEETRHAFDSDGFFRTGDLATFDAMGLVNVPPEKGYVRIIGRLKEIVITAAGENISPVFIEDNIKSALPIISNCILIGDKRQFLSVLLTIKTEIDPLTGESTAKLSPEVTRIGLTIGSKASTITELKIDRRWSSYIDAGIVAANRKSALSVLTVKKWRILDEDFTQQGEELTPTLKLRRFFIAQKYAGIIEDIYSPIGELNSKSL